MSQITRRQFLFSAGRLAACAALTPVLPALLTGCESMGDITAMSSNMAASAGLLTQAQIGL